MPYRIDIQNENYGYAVATHDTYVAAASPATLRYSGSVQSGSYTGSVDYYKYNKNTDYFDCIGKIFRREVGMDIILAAESSSGKYDTQTELNNIPPEFIEIDKEKYKGVYEDGFGYSVDMYNNLLVVGCPYYLQYVKTETAEILTSGSSINVFDLSSQNGDMYIYGIENPNLLVSESFGKSVSINNEWLAVGSPNENGSLGTVYLYRNNSTGSSYDWQYYQQITASTLNTINAEFGHSLKLDKQSGSYSGNLVVGCGNPKEEQVFYFEFISGSWTETYIFKPNTDQYNLTFGNYLPYSSSSNPSGSGFGHSVSTFQKRVIIGEYMDRLVSEFSGSSMYEQGSVSIYELCNNSTNKFNLVYKTYGTPTIMKNNRLGYSVDIFGDYAVAGIPKPNNENMESLYVISTITQLHYPENSSAGLSGQFLLMTKNSSSGEWNSLDIFQKSKDFMSPYRCYGNSTAIGKQAIVVGAPMLLLDEHRSLTLDSIQSGNATIDDICGKIYIHMISSLRGEYHIGNAFYRNGKIVLTTTSGSIFDNLMYDPNGITPYLYDIKFKTRHTIFEKNIICNIEPGEFNTSTNPSAVTKPQSVLDLNKNGVFDFQDADAILRYMAYKNSIYMGVTPTTNWSSSIITTDDEQSLLDFYKSNIYINDAYTTQLAQQCIDTWTLGTEMESKLDFNQDNQIDVRDMLILWKYFANRLNQVNYNSYITPICKRKYFNDIIDYMDILTCKSAIPMIKGDFLEYEKFAAIDKTGSYLAPYVTEIGLYSGLDLVMVARMGNPIKLMPDMPINFIIKMDY